MTSAPIAMGPCAAPTQYPPAGFVPPGIALIAYHIAESHALAEREDQPADLPATSLAAYLYHGKARARQALSDHHWTQAVKLVRALLGSRSGREQLASASMHGLDLDAVLQSACA